MKKFYWFLGFCLIFSVSCFAYVVLNEWQINSGYYIKFDGKYADGSFNKLDGTIEFDANNLSKSKFDVTVDVKSIDTGKDLKNKHAESEKWFDAEKYPVIHFVSSEITKTDSAYIVNGELELHGIKKPLSIPFTFKNNNEKATFHGEFKVDRGEFGIGKSTGKESDFTHVEVLVPVVGK